jgi:hypothetical protein
LNFTAIDKYNELVRIVLWYRLFPAVGSLAMH